MLTACKGELPNPYKDSQREILSSLICYDNDVKRLTVELRDLQRQFKSEMEKLEFSCQKMRLEGAVCAKGTDSGLSSPLKVSAFATHIAAMEEMKRCFTERIEDVQKTREEMLAVARQNLKNLQVEKNKFKHFHESTVDYLKQYSANSHEPMVMQNCQKDICEMQKLFVEELQRIAKTENELQPFFQMLLGSGPQDGDEVRAFKEFDWLPKGRDPGAMDALTNKMKNLMGPTLRRAFAQCHIQQPQDVKSFLAGYLMNLEHNEERVQEKLNIFGSLE